MLQYNCLLLCRNMETLPNLCFAYFYRRIGNSSKKKIHMVKAARSRQTCEVATRDSSDHQFLNHDFSEHVVANLLDKDLRSRQRIEVATRKDSRPNESCCDKRKVAETKKDFQRKILSRHRSVCCDTKRKQIWSQQIIDVTTRNGCLMN